MLESLNMPNFPLKWAKTEYLRENTSPRREIYLKDRRDTENDLISLFYTLFGNYKDQLLVYDKLWWHFCISVWNIHADTNNFEPEDKSDQCGAYLNMLKESGIDREYTGCCKCNSWDVFLPVVLKCILSHEAPYSPLFVDPSNGFFFYFHHTGSIGIYYDSNDNIAVQKILAKAAPLYDVVDAYQPTRLSSNK